MHKSLRASFISSPGSLLFACILTLAGGGTAQAATTTLADTPVYSASNVPANLMLALSVEFPTGTVGAYKDASGYSTSGPGTGGLYLGYFDSSKCYNYDSTDGYFTPVSGVSGPVCTGYWSGNMLNWATMTALDEFRQSLTGGNRSVDTATTTVLLRSNLNSQSTKGNFPDKQIGSSVNVSPSTVIGDAPYSTATNVYFRSYAQGTQFIVSNNSSFSNTGTSGSGSSKYNNSATTYNAQVQVCVSGIVESDCTQYGSNYKPEGLIQQNYKKIRVGAAAYALQKGDGAANGAIRALLRDNGPTTYNGNGARQTNPYTEWNKDTGVFVGNPDTGDVTGTAPGGGNATQSGAINYLNQFGYGNGYETYDTIADLYWAALSYFMKVPLDSSYTSGLTASNSLDPTFPVLTGTALNDPIQYTCQANAIVTIGDSHTWYDTRVPSSGGPSGYSTAQAPLTPVSGVDAEASVTKLGNLPLIEATGGNPASITMAQLRQAGSAASTSTTVNTPLGQQYEPNGTTHPTYNMAGLAYYAHTNDIRTDLTNSQTIDTYTVDVLEPGPYDGTSGKEIYNPSSFSTSGGAAGPNMYWLAAKYGGFNDISGNGIPANFLTWHTNSSTAAAKNLRPDNYFPGNRPDLIQSGLKQIFQHVASTSIARGAAPGVTSTRALTSVTASTAPYYSPVSGFPIYNVQYKPVSWDGDVSGFVASNTAGGSVTPVAGTNTWSAQAQLETLTQYVSGTSNGWDTGRRVLTWNNSTKKGVPFRYSNLSTTEQTAIGSSSLLNFLRGDKSNESTNFHVRSHILGDIVNSQAVLVQSALSPSYSESANPGYTAFATSVKNRQPVVYVGANDGMLHAFEADFSNPTTTNPVTGGGSELFAYVPSLLYAGPNNTPQVDGLAALANLDGVTTNNYSHHFYVDSTPQVGDVDFSYTGLNPTVSTATTSSWHTILVDGLGKGGKGIFALDITNVPSAIQTTGSNTATGEQALTSKVLWEFTDADMGYSYGHPLILKTRKYGWVVVMTSGYNNTTGTLAGHGILYVLNAKTGALLQKIDTGVGSATNPAGLAQATGYTQDVSDGTIDQVYAGDLLGNVWRFDLSETALDSSGNPTPDYPSPTLFAKLTDPSGNPQPITTAPRIEEGIDSTGLGTLRWVFVGTGQFLDTSDLNNTQQQTMYALRDGSGSTPSTTGLPLTRSALVANPLTTPLNLADSASGWYYDLPGTAGSNGGTERIVVNPDASAGVSVVAWATVTPSTDPCSLQGNIYAADFSTGQSVLQDSAGNVMSSVTTNTATTGLQMIQLPNGEFAILYGQTGSLPQTAKIKQPPGGNLLNRVNWREILN